MDCPLRLSWAVELLQLRPTEHVLELGCGHGLALPLVWSQVPQGRLVALDRSASALSAAQKRCPDAEILSQDLSGASFPSASFDAVFAVNVAALHRDEALLRRVCAWLRPQGKLVLVQQPPSSDRTPTLARELQAALAALGSLEPLLYREIEGVNAVAAVARAPSGARLQRGA